MKRTEGEEEHTTTSRNAVKRATVDIDPLPSGEVKSILNMATNSDMKNVFFLQLVMLWTLVQFTQLIIKCGINKRDEVAEIK